MIAASENLEVISLFIRIGLFSSLIRNQAQMPGLGSKWMVMDGDIDPMWIESLNTVMDDNKVLMEGNLLNQMY